jgi:hypothetical protein
MNVLTANGLPDISAHNPFKDASQGVADHFYNNLSFNATVEELNQKIGSSPQMVRNTGEDVKAEPSEPLFGTHIREAAASVKKLFR